MTTTATTPPILILDGGLGTTLEQNHGCRFDSSSTPLWSSHLLITDPDTLLACQRSFGRIPVDVILTATYQVSAEGFAKTVTGDHPDGIQGPARLAYIERAFTIAEDAKAAGAASGAVALSVGPYGACMIPSQEYSGIYDEAHSSVRDLTDWHLQRMRDFASVRDLASRIGYVALETIPRSDEIHALRRAISECPELFQRPFWMSALYPGEGDTIPDGSTASQVVRAMLDPQVSPHIPWGIGINCTKVWKLDSLLREYEATVEDLVAEERISEWPALVLYPDGTNGEVYNTTTQNWDPPADSDVQNLPPWAEQLAGVVKTTAARGRWRAIVVGGCCMASPDHIRALRQCLLNGSQNTTTT